MASNRFLYFKNLELLSTPRFMTVDQSGFAFRQILIEKKCSGFV